MPYVTDTHSIVWYMTDDPRLSIEAKRTFEKVDGGQIEPLCLSIIEKSRMISRRRIPDPWDRLIAATSIHLGFPLITRDKSLQKIGLKVIW